MSVASAATVVGGFTATALAGFEVIPAYVGYPAAFLASVALAFLGTGQP